MNIIKRLYPLYENDGLPEAIEKINAEFENILKTMNKLGFEPGGQQENFIYNITASAVSGNVNVYEFNFDYTTSTISLISQKLKLIQIIVDVRSAFNRGVRLKVESSSKILLSENEVLLTSEKSTPKFMNYSLLPPDKITLSLTGDTATQGSGKILLVTA
jgi:hypothetical protein